ncbi:hypothetical protein BROUX41_003663 [Berkeleyomyces rouxiae]|uniref:uncharacterized protein n=1 Tax=Berkeleyomyces rouxiae TaxID=2035830 RepID=UPI003B81823B
MTVTYQVSPELGYVLSVAAASFILSSALGMQVSTYRKDAGIKYPIAYANDELAAKDPKAFKFNCAQRVHLNYGEVHTSWLGALLISGLRYPVAAASIGGAWLVGRALYSRGYVVNGPEGRLGGAVICFFTDNGLKAMALYTGIMFALGR